MAKTTPFFAFSLAAVFLIVQTCATWGQSLPVHEGTRLLRSGSLVVEVGDPESNACRWNTGVRFSPVANVLRVQLDGREFAYSPVNGGAVGSGFAGGLPMEFDIGQEDFQPDPPGYNEGRNGDPFLKIGVGILRRDGSAYNFSRDYPVIEPAHTSVTWQPDRAHFVQTLSGTANGYACRLEEDLIVKNDRLIMHYRLHNTGTKEFTTEQYIHNFLRFDGRSVGPKVKLSFPYDFTASPAVAPWTPPGPLRSPRIAAGPDVVRVANAILYMQRISSVPKIWIYKPQDYARPDVFRAEHTATLQSIVIGSSIPAAYIGIWTTDYQVSPEQFIRITLAPGQMSEFTRTYVFSVDGFVPQDCTGDGTVDTNDLSRLSGAWLSTSGTQTWNPFCDISAAKDDRIDLRDVSAMARQWRQKDGLPAPVAHWRLDEAGGTTAFDERGQHDGVLCNFGDARWVEGVNGTAVQFDGIDDCIEIAGDVAITGTRPRTVSAWIKLGERPVENQAILAWGEPAPGRYWLLEANTGRMLRFCCGTGYAVAASIPVADMKWHHIAAVLDPLVPDAPSVSDVKLYVDGRLQSVFEIAEHRIDTAGSANLRIGAARDTDAGGHFKGAIDDVRLYDAALSAANIRHIRSEALF